VTTADWVLVGSAWEMMVTVLPPIGMVEGAM
jgi:hypothetical protein